jgi:TonB family protein
MKNTLLTLLISFFLTAAYSQDMGYELRERNTRAVTKEKLYKVKLISDIIPGYPVNWIRDYVSVEIMTTFNDKSLKEMSANDVLSTQQQNILNNADPGTDIAIYVVYKLRNPITDKLETSTMNVMMTVVPEVEAEYMGGKPQMKKYLLENFSNKINETIPIELQEGMVKFTVNEAGEISNAHITKSSGDLKTDQLLLEALNKMPKWKPAENSSGIKVKQEFAFGLGKAGC